jgi:hypothetical protein
VSGNTQSYADGFLFVVEDILGVVKWVLKKNKGQSKSFQGFA